MPNGLDDLSRKVQERNARREQRRQAPPPRHPRPVKDDPPAAEDPAAQAHDVPGPAPEPATAPLPGAPEQRDPETPRAASDEPRLARRPGLTQVYLDPETEAWVWEVVTAAAQRRTRVPVSAIVRRALRELAARTTPEQLAEEITSQPRSGGRGRPRL